MCVCVYCFELKWLKASVWRMSIEYAHIWFTICASFKKYQNIIHLSIAIAFIYLDWILERNWHNNKKYQKGNIRHQETSTPPTSKIEIERVEESFHKSNAEYAHKHTFTVQLQSFHLKKCSFFLSICQYVFFIIQTLNMCLRCARYLFNPLVL